MLLKDITSLDKAILLHEGITNESYLLDNTFVYRNKEVVLDPFNKPENESKILKEIAGFDFTEKVLDYDPNTGKKLSLFISGTKRLSNPPTKQELELVANVLNRLHHSSIKMDNDFSPFARLSFYKKDVKSEIDSSIEEIIINKAKKLYEKFPLIPSHNDVVKGNLLFKDNYLYLLDFEYAGNNIELFDIASFLSENNITDDSQIEFFISHFENINKKDVISMIDFENILWYYWAKYLFNISKKPIFLEIANSKLAAINNI